MIENVISAVKEWKARKPQYDTYRAYYRGQHELKFATPDFQRKHGALFASLRENLCRAVVTAHTDRLRVERWGDKDDNTEADDQGLTRLQGLVHREAYRCGDAYSLTWKGADGSRRPHPSPRLPAGPRRDPAKAGLHVLQPRLEGNPHP